MHIPIANNKVLLAEASLMNRKEKMITVLPTLKIIAAQYGLRLNRPDEYAIVKIVYLKSLKQN